MFHYNMLTHQWLPASTFSNQWVAVKICLKHCPVCFSVRRLYAAHFPRKSLSCLDRGFSPSMLVIQVSHTYNNTGSWRLASSLQVADCCFYVLRVKTAYFCIHILALIPAIVWHHSQTYLLINQVTSSQLRSTSMASLSLALVEHYYGLLFVHRLILSANLYRCLSLARFPLSFFLPT